jgi:cell division transport system permease protein
MIGLPWVPGRRRRLPLGRDESVFLLPWLVGFMVYVAALCGIGLLLVGEVLRGAEQSLAARITVQVPAEATDARLQTVLALLRQTPGVVAAEPLTPADTARLLEPWLGSPLSLDELPVPRLIDLRLDPNAAVDLAAMRRQLAAVVADARIDDHHAWLGGLRAGERPIRAVLVMLIVVSIGLVLVSAIVAARTALTARQSAVELFQLLGADDGDIAWPFALRTLWLGLLGGAIGAGAALLTVLFLRPSGGLVQLPAPITASGLADWRLWAIAIVAALIAGLVAFAGAQLTALRRLGRMS